MVATTVAVPAVVVFKMLPSEILPPAVLGVPILHVMVWLVALLGTTVPLSVNGRYAVAVVGMPVIPVTGTKSVAIGPKFADVMLPSQLAAVTTTVMIAPMSAVVVA